MGRGIRAGALAATLALAACGGGPPVEEVSDPFAGPLPEAAPVTTAPLEEGSDAGEDGSDTVTRPGPGGLVERLPNTCQLENYRQFVGADGLTAASQVIERPTRVVAPDAIVSQVYEPRRVNFYTDGAGRVVRVSCG